MNKHKAIITILILLVFNICYTQEYSTGVVESDYVRKNYLIRTNWYESFHKKNLPKKLKNTLDSIAKEISLGIEDEVDVYKNFAVFTKDSLKTIFTLDGKQILEFQYNSFFKLYPSNTLFLIEIENKWGVFNSDILKVIIPCIYKDISSVKKGVFSKKNTSAFLVSAGINEVKYGVIDSNKKELIPLMYSELEFKKKYYVAKKDEKFGVNNYKNENIIPFIYQNIEHFENPNYIPVELNSKWGFINKKNEYVILPIYDDLCVNGFNHKRIRVRKDNKTGFINEKGEILIDLKYKDADISFRNNVLRVKKNDGKFYLVNKKGKEICQNGFDGMGKFRDILTLVKLKGKFGVINTKCKIVIPIEYDEIYSEPEVIFCKKGDVRKQFMRKDFYGFFTRLRLYISYLLK